MEVKSKKKEKESKMSFHPDHYSFIQIFQILIHVQMLQIFETLN